MTRKSKDKIIRGIKSQKLQKRHPETGADPNFDGVGSIFSSCLIFFQEN
jgi:hypothetical protein